MDADRAIAIINTVLAPKSLKLVQMQIIRGVLAGNSYQQIAAIGSNVSKESQLPQSESQAAGDKTVGGVSPLEPRPRTEVYQSGYVRETAARLWQSLSQRLGQKVSKKSLAAVLLWYSMQLGVELLEGQIAATVPTGAGRQRNRTDGRTLDWHPTVPSIEPHFYGRMEEIATLTDWCLYERCRVIFLIGMGGMGKTTLVREIARQLEGYFDLTIWRSLLNLPPLTEFCADLLQCLSPHPLVALPTAEEGIDLLIAGLKRDRCLLIIDNVESILKGQVQSGQYLPGYEGYDLLFRALGELPHQSCAIFTSREQPHSIARAQIVNPQLVRSMTLDGLTNAAGHQLIQAYGCPPLPAQMWQEVHAHYGGNPLALKIAAIAAVEITGGGEKVLELYPLMKQGQLQFRTIDDVLYRQFERLSEIEQQLVYWLAIEREPIAGSELRANLVLNTRAPGEILNALQSLARRCITTCHDQTWSIQPVMVTYVTSRSIERFGAELAPPVALDLAMTDLPQRFCHLNTYAIIQATAKDYLRQTQIQFILRPIVERSLQTWDNHQDFIQHLRQILRQWQTLDPIPPGYLAGNILNLLIELAPDRCLQDLDCSQLPIRAAYLAEVKLDRVNFAAVTFDACVFAQASGNGIKSIAFLPQQNWLASGHRDCQIRLWDLQTRTCIQTLSGHTDAIGAIAISPDGRYLASSSLDRTIRIWDLPSLECIHTLPQQRGDPDDPPVRSCALIFAPDGHQLIAGCQIWDVATGKLDRTLSGHPNQIQAVAVCKLHQLLVTACEHQIRLWDLQTDRCLHTIIAHHLPVICVAFSPDGRYLATGSMDKTVKIWDASSWKCLQTLTGHHSLTLTVAFSPTPINGTTTDYHLIVGSGDRLMTRWNITTGECLQTYTGHINWIWSLAYSPDGTQIASAGEDETIEIWEIEGTQALYTLRLKRPYEDLNITGATGLQSEQRQTLKLLGAIDD